MNQQIGNYHVLFYQPSPELGERVAIGLLFEEKQGSFSLHYSPDFPKLSRLYPDTDVDIVRFYLEDLRKSLSSCDNSTQVLARYGPQIVRSEARKIALPIKAATVDMLTEKILFAQRVRRKRDAESASAKLTSMVGAAIEEFVVREAQIQLRMKRNADVSLWEHRPVRDLKKVALAVESDLGWTLIDGVNLNLMTPNEAEKHADAVARNFWEYKKFVVERLGKTVRRIGLVMNGQSHLHPAMAAAHEFALHRLDGDSDLALDTCDRSAVDRLRQQLLGHS